jgi:hypothetical protein
MREPTIYLATMRMINGTADKERRDRLEKMAGIAHA